MLALHRPMPQAGDGGNCGFAFDASRFPAMRRLPQCVTQSPPNSWDDP
jgi:hypothetical protein